MISSKKKTSVYASGENPLPRLSSSSLQYPSGFRCQNSPHRHSAVKELKSLIEETNTANVYDVAVETPLELAAAFSKKLGANLWLKRDDL